MLPDFIITNVGLDSKLERELSDKSSASWLSGPFQTAVMGFTGCFGWPKPQFDSFHLLAESETRFKVVFK